MSLAKPTVDQRATEQLLREAIAVVQDDSRKTLAAELPLERQWLNVAGVICRLSAETIEAEDWSGGRP